MNTDSRGCANGFSDLLGLHAAAANLLSVGGALVNPESEYYFDWHAQIDNPVSTLKGAIAFLILNDAFWSYPDDINTADAISAMRETIKQCE